MRAYLMIRDGIETFHAGGGHLVGSMGPLLFAGFHGPADPLAWAAYKRAIEHHAAQAPRPRVYLHVTRPTGATVGAADRMRAEYQALLRRYRREYCAIALVVVNAGVGGAMMRAMLAGFSMVAQDGAKMRGFDALGPAVQWLDREHRAAGAPGLGEALPAIEQAIRQAGIPLWAPAER